MKLSTTMMINETLLPTNKKAFTLAEVLITLSILGVVAAMTIPTLVNRQSDIAAQTRLRKAISNYHDLIEVYLLESGAEDASALFDAGCEDAGQYFKITNQDAANGCIFVTADGARWEFDPDTGNAVVTDSEAVNATPRYGVIMWNAQGFVNSDQCQDSDPGDFSRCGTHTAAPEDTIAEAHRPVNGYFNAKEFLANTGAQLKTKALNGARATADTAAAAGDANDIATTTGIARAIAE